MLYVILVSSVVIFKILFLWHVLFLLPFRLAQGSLCPFSTAILFLLVVCLCGVMLTRENKVCRKYYLASQLRFNIIANMETG